MSARRDDSVYLAHIRDAARRIAEYLEGLTESTFYETPLVQDGVIRQIQIIGEAVKRLTPEFRASTSDIPWIDIAGMRNKLVRDYMGVDLEAVWDTAVIEVPKLLDRLGAGGPPAGN
jgi:uncharacterized protein with HEPN domain